MAGLAKFMNTALLLLGPLLQLVLAMRSFMALTLTIDVWPLSFTIAFAAWLLPIPVTLWVWPLPFTLALTARFFAVTT